MMKKQFLLLFVALLMATLSSWAQTTNFETFSAGTVNYKGTGSTKVTGAGYTIPSPYGSLWTTADEWGFQKVVPYDQGVKDDGTGNKVWRMSNAVISSGFSDQAYSPSSALPAGETTAALWNDRGTNHTTPLSPPLFRANAATKYFHGGFRFKSATGASQTGLFIGINAAPRQGSVRMSYIAINDVGTGLNLEFAETLAGGSFAPSNTIIATGLSYSAWHQVDFYVEFVDGLNGDGTGNDKVTVMLDGTVIHTGTTWETYYATPGWTSTPDPIAVDAILFAARGTAVPANSGNGLYFDDVTVNNAQVPVVAAPSPITTIGTPIPTTCGTFDVPVKVSDFKNVGAISLSLNYATALNYQGVTLNSAIASATAEAFTPGLFKLSWGGGVSGITINDNDVLFTLHFNLPTATKGSTDFTWDNSNCEIAGPGSNDPVIYDSNFNNLTANFPTRPVKNTNTGWEYCTIQAAIDDAATLNGHEITVADGTYVLTSTLNIGKELSIIGASEAGTIINASAIGGYGLEIHASNVTLKNFTILPNATGSYTLKTNPNGAIPFDKLALENITIDGSKKTAFDIHGYDNVTLKDLTATNTISGNGISLTGCNGVTMTGITTATNAWGGIAVYVSKAAYVNRGSSNISLDFALNNIGEFLYVEDEFGLVNSNITVSNWTYGINNDYSATTNYTAYIETPKANALAMGAGLNTKFSNMLSYVWDPTITTHHVGPGMSIQRAIDMASANYIVDVTAGAYNENVIVNKDVTLLGANVGIACTERGAESKIAALGGTAVAVEADGVTIDGFEITNPTGKFAITATSRNNLLIQNNNVNTVGTIGAIEEIHSIAIVMGSSVSDNVDILNNCISNIGHAGSNGSAVGIGVGWSNATTNITNLLIERNTIANVKSARGAYGMIVNVGGKSTGQATAASIRMNTISDLIGGWVTAIGLEGNTPGVIVENNLVSNLTSTPTAGYTTAVKIEENTGAASVNILNNSFTNMAYGISNVTPLLANATCNWYGAGVVKNYGSVTVAPWLIDGTNTITSGPGFVPLVACAACSIELSATKVDVSCSGSADGGINLSVTGAITPVAYSWTGPSYSSTVEDLSELVAGDYTVIVTGTNGCTATKTVTVGTVSDVTPPTIVGTLAPITVEGCAASSAPAAKTLVTELVALGLVISDNCALNPDITSNDVAVGTCPIVVTRTYTVNDATGNGNTITHIINVTHLTAPAEVGGPVASASSVECESAALPPTTLPVVQDVCHNPLTPGAPIKQVSFTNKFDDAVLLGATAAPGIWNTDRYNPAGFVSASFLGDNRLKESIDAGDFQTAGFYRTQGRGYEVGTSTNEMQIKLFVPSAWQTSNSRLAGFWGVAVDATNARSGYPIVEFTSDGNNPRFRVWESGTGEWINMGLPAGFAYDSWVTLKIRLLSSGEFLISAGSLSYVTYTSAPDASVRLKSVILQGYNAPSTYDIYWDDFTWNDTYSALACEGAITYTYNYADCAGLPYAWTYTYNIDHVTAPVVTADGALTVECLTSAVAPALPTVTDKCGTTLTPELVSTVDSPTDLTCGGTRTYNYKYTDCSGLVSNWKHVYTIQHTTAPSVFTSAPTDGGTKECISAATAPTTLPVVKDVCGNILEPIGAPTVGGDYAGCEGTYTYTYNYKDCANLTLAWTYSYTIDHTTAPVVPANGAKTVACLSNAINPALIPTIVDQQQIQTYANGNWTDFTSIGQSFTCGTSGWFTKLDLQVKTLTAAQSFTLKIYLGNGISGTELYNGSHSLSATGWQSLNIAQELAPYLTAGTQYTFWLTTFTYNQLGLLCMNPNVYNGGVAMDGCTAGCSSAYAWQQWPNYDLVFKTYMSVVPVVVDVCNNVIPTPTPIVVDNITNCAGTRAYTYNYADCSGLTTPWVYTYTIAPVDFSLPANGTSTVACVSNVVTPTPPTVNDACGNPMTPVKGTFPAAPACEGTMIYSWTYTDCAGHNHVWTHTVTIDDIIAPTISFTPADITVNMNTGCTATGVNLGTVVASDNCNGIVNITNDAPTVFPVGETIVTWTVKDCALNSVTSTQKVTVIPNTLSGTMVYNNASGAKTPMSNVELTLSKAGAFVATDETDANGNYTFGDLCTGDYTIAVTGNAKPLGGINATDALGVNYWSAYFGSIEQVKFMAGDVSIDNNFMDATDALTIQKSFVKPTVFNRAPWSYWKQGDMILNNGSPYSIIDLAHPWPTDIKVSVNGDVANFNLYAMVTGDFNGSFRPDVTKSANWTMELNTSSMMSVSANQAFELPIRAASAMQVSAVSMILNVQSKLVSVQEVLVNGSTAPVSWAVIGDELRIAWNSLTPVQVSENGNLLTLKLKTTNAFTVGQTMDISLKFDPLNELADGNLEVINGANLLAAQIANGVTGIINPADVQSLALSNYPNPFKGSTTVDYQLPVNGKVTINVYNQIGQLVKTLVDGNQNAGDYSIRMDANNLMPGIYIAKLRLTNTNVELTGTLKLSVLK